MPTEHVREALRNLATLRERSRITRESLEEKLLLGPGWVRCFENGDVAPPFGVVLAYLDAVNSSLAEFASMLPPPPEAAEVERRLTAEEQGGTLVLRFPYGEHEAQYLIEDASIDQYERVIKLLRDGLAATDGSDSDAQKANAVADAFLAAVETWPGANPSDLWYFLVYRAYLDPFNHPAIYARLEFLQSWKRTGGWALERVLVRHYGPYLEQHGVRLLIGNSEEKNRYLSQLETEARLEADKIDVLLIGEPDTCFGAVHVKASFAERRTDDVPMSEAMVKAGYTSPLWTMDAKSPPSARPMNRGELGRILEAGQPDKRSAKRKDIEDDSYFSACFSYNQNTKATPPTQRSSGRIIVCDFTNPEDAFSQFLISRWQEFRNR